ncbi:MAG: polymer-forming cytoskeletal protein [Dongiaceae bacterium]
MFSKGSKPTDAYTPSTTEPARTPARGASPSIISADLRIVGDLASAGDLQIDGEVEGDIQSRTLTVGEGAQVKGSLSAETVRVCGSVSGQIKATTVVLDKTARVTGDIMHTSLAIEPGAFLEGHCRRLDTASKVSAANVSPMKDKDRPSDLGGPTVAAVNS